MVGGHLPDVGLGGLGPEVVGAGGDHGGLIEGDNGAVVVLNQGTGSGQGVAVASDDASVASDDGSSVASDERGHSHGGGQNGEKDDLEKSARFNENEWIMDSY